VDDGNWRAEFLSLTQPEIAKRSTAKTGLLAAAQSLVLETGA